MQRVFVVTGANKGIGYGIVKGLAEKVHNGLIYLTARDVRRGEEALKKVINELGERRKSEIRVHQLDITKKDSIEKLAAHLKKEHNGFDVLVNNAGFAFPMTATEPGDVQARVTIGINYEATKQACELLLPLLRSGGRVVNVASQAGLMTPDRYSEEIIEKMTKPSLTVAEIDEFCEDFIRASIEGTRKEHGYPNSAYRVSKAALIALTFIQARELRARNIVVNACCPGHVNTDMSNHTGSLSIEEGADTPVYLATLKEDEPCGKFVYLRKPMEWTAKGMF